MGSSSGAGIGPVAARRATIVLIGLRVFYAYNWFDIGPALPRLGEEFSVGPAAWGVLLASFFIGAGILQVPAGLLAARWGTRRVAVLGAALLGVSALAASFAPNFESLVVLRGVSGAGAGLFFSPAIALVASLHREGQRGVPVGVFSSAYSAGAGLGVLATSLLIPLLGWRGSLAVGGLVMLGLLATTVWIPSEAGAPPPRRDPAAIVIPAALRSPAVWAIGLAFIGIEGASLSAGQLFVPYAEAVRGWAPFLAGAIATLLVFPSFFGGPVGGWMAEAYANRRTQLAVFSALAGGLLVLVPVAPFALLVLIAVAFAFSYGMVYAMMYILPAYLPGLPPEQTPLAIGLFNGIQLTGGAAIAALAGWTISAAGYAVGWLVLGGSAAAALAFLVFLPPADPRTSIARGGL
ncbi:MAG TPA: MFS transporter [Thermoplasmata archaeon]|nr:MFS transporter [Thermoplasmata archaeon]